MSVQMASDEETRWQEDEFERDSGYEKTALVSKHPGDGVSKTDI
jgi:hypothetical protein